MGATIVCHMPSSTKCDTWQTADGRRAQAYRIEVKGVGDAEAINLDCAEEALLEGCLGCLNERDLNGEEEAGVAINLRTTNMAHADCQKGRWKRVWGAACEAGARARTCPYE